VPQTLALFDIDGTLTTEDTMFSYVRFVVGTPRYLAGLLWLSPILALAWLKLTDRAAAKGRMLKWFFRGRSRKELEAAAERFCSQRVPQLLRPEGIAALRKHRDDGHTVLLVSASLDLWLRPFAEAEGVLLLCTPTGWVGDQMDGLGGPNCHGPEKVRRVREQVDTEEYGQIEAFGDSSGDREMLAMATNAHFKPFRDR
jgi:HAD superfamily hydrolase (TIGR01490 family)